jgi:predicted RNase H-like HicB family nuclease
MDASYYSIIERAEDGHFHGWVPDLAGVSADGRTEKEVIDRLFREVRERLRNLILTGAPVPRPRPAEELSAAGGDCEIRRLLLVVT